MKKWNLAIVAVLIMAGAARTLSQDTRPADGINPDAPKETAQFAFTLGKWNVTYKNRKRDGTYSDGTARAESRLIHDGFALQGFWRGNKPDGSISRGTYIRSFDARAGEWIEYSTPIPANSRGVLTMKGTYSDGQLVIEGGRGQRISRYTFHDISKDHYKLKLDMSPDGGENWIMDFGLFDYKRAPEGE